MPTAAVIGGSALLGAVSSRESAKAAESAAATQAAAARSSAEITAESSERIAAMQTQAAERAAGLQARSIERAAELRSESALEVANLRSQAAERASEIQALASQEATGLITDTQRQRLEQARIEFSQLQNNLANAEQRIQAQIQPITDVERAGLQRQEQVLGGQAGLALGAQRELGELLGLGGAEAQESAQRGILESPAQQALRDRAARLSTRTASAIGGLGGGNIRRQLFEEGRALDASTLTQRISQLGALAQLGTQGLGIGGTALAAGTAERGAGRETGLASERLRTLSNLENVIGSARAAEILDPAAARAAGILGTAGARASGLAEAAQATTGGILGTAEARAGGITAGSAAQAAGLTRASEAIAGGQLAAGQAAASGILGAAQARNEGLQSLGNIGVLAGMGAFRSLTPGTGTATTTPGTIMAAPSVGVGTTPLLGIGQNTQLLAPQLDI